MACPTWGGLRVRRVPRAVVAGANGEKEPVPLLATEKQ